MALDTRWKNPQSNSNENLYLWAQDLIKELRKGDYLDNVATGITNAQLVDMADSTIKGRAAGAGTGAPQDLTATQATAILNNFVGDSGSGGTKGLVPAPITGDATKFLRGDATWAAAGALVLLASGTVSAAASLNIVLTSYTAYRAIKFVLQAFVPATDDSELWMRFSTNGGSSYDAGASDYAYSAVGLFNNATAANFASVGTTKIVIAGSATGTFAVSNVASEGGVDIEVTLHDQANTGDQTR